MSTSKPAADWDATPNESTLLFPSGEDDDLSTYGATEAPPVRMNRSHSITRREERKQEQKKQWKLFRTKARYYLPILFWLPRYNLRAFVGDLASAFTMTAIIVPQSMSYATSLANLDPISGLFSAAIPAIIYSVLGTCRELSVGPEASLSLLTGQVINQALAKERHLHPDLTRQDEIKIATTIATVIAFESGVVTFCLGILRLGFLDAVLSRALLRGFISAVAMVISVNQLSPILGIPLPHGIHGVVEKFSYIVSHVKETNTLTLTISVISLSLLVFIRTFKSRLIKYSPVFSFLSYIPEVLLVVVGTTVLSSIFNWKSSGVDVLGHVSASEDIEFRLPFLDVGTYLSDYFAVSTVVAFIGFLDSIVAAKDVATRKNYPISPNRELVALGAANIFTSFFSGSLTGFGSITRTRLASATGATTQMTSLLTGTFVLLVSVFLLPLLESLPKCILSVVICLIVYSILSEIPEDLEFFYRMRAWEELSVMMLAFGLTAFVSVEAGIMTSIALSMLLCIKESAAVRIKILGRVRGTDYYEPLDDDEDELLPLNEEIPGVLIVRLRDVSLTFANAGALKERLRRLERYGNKRHHPSEAPRRDEASIIVFHISDVDEIDATALQIIYEIVEGYVKRNVLIHWVGVLPHARLALEKAGIIKLSGGATHVHSSVHDALNESQGLERRV